MCSGGAILALQSAAPAPYSPTYSAQLTTGSTEECRELFIFCSHLPANQHTSNNSCPLRRLSMNCDNHAHQMTVRSHTSAQSFQPDDGSKFEAIPIHTIIPTRCMFEVSQKTHEYTNSDFYTTVHFGVDAMKKESFLSIGTPYPLPLGSHIHLPGTWHVDVM